MKTFSIFVGVVFTLILPLGCGQSQDDIRKYAIRRPKDDDDSPSQNRPSASGSTANPSAAPPPSSTTALNTASTSPVVVAPTPPASVPSAGGAPLVTGPIENVKATAATGTLSDTIPHDTTWTPQEQRARAIDHLKRVAEGLQKYQTEKGIFPAPAITSADGRPLLSWRVEILPQLGYGALASAFRRDEPWDSPHNQTLLKQIPSVYQSPERLDERTNLLVPVGSSAAFHGSQGRSPRRWEDGLSNIVLLLEVDNDLAVPWTAPQDWPIESNPPLRGLGALRGDGFFAAWADAQVALLPKDLSQETARAMFSVDGGEAFSAASISRQPTAELPQATRSVRLAIPENIGNSSAHRTVESPTASSSTASSSTANASLGSTTNEAGSELLRQAVAAYEAGASHDAMALAMATYLADPQFTSSFTFQWISGLRRPALALRYGIGVTYSGVRADQLTRQFAPTSTESAAAIGAYEGLLGDLGKTVMEQVRAQKPFLPAAFNVIDPSRKAPHDTAIAPVGMGNPGELRQAALRDAIDVLLHFEVEERRSARGGIEATTVSLNVMDVWSGQILLKSSRINYLKRERMRSEPLFVDPVEEVAREMEEMLSKRLRPRPIPGELRGSHAEKRVTQLTKVHREYPLPILCEIKFYRESNLISASQALTAFQSLTEPSAGTELLAGTVVERQEALRPWLPRSKDYIAPARRTQSAEADD